MPCSSWCFSWKIRKDVLKVGDGAWGSPGPVQNSQCWGLCGISIPLPSVSLSVHDLHSTYSEVQLGATAPELNLCDSYLACGVMNFHSNIQFRSWNCAMCVNFIFPGEVLKSCWNTSSFLLLNLMVNRPKILLWLNSHYVCLRILDTCRNCWRKPYENVGSRVIQPLYLCS